MTSGIYKIESVVEPDKFYIGSSVDIERRLKEHFKTLKNSKHCNKKLQYYYNKYKSNILSTTIIEIVLNKKDLINKEQYYLDTLNPYFNLCKIAGSKLGTKLSQETKDKIGKAHKGNTYSLGLKWNSKQRKNHSNRIQNLIKEGLWISPSKGKAISENARLEMIKANTGRKNSIETIEKMSNSAKGRKLSIETINKIILKTTGLKRTLEQKKNISNSLSKQFIRCINKITNTESIYHNQKACAKALGISRSYVTMILNGTRKAKNKHINYNLERV